MPDIVTDPSDQLASLLSALGIDPDADLDDQIDAAAGIAAKEAR